MPGLLAHILVALLAVTATSEEDERILVQLFANGEDRGQALWLSRDTHFRDLSTFQRLMQSYVENGVSNWGYNRPMSYEAKVYRQDGQVVAEWGDVQEGDSLYVVPYDDLFMWAGVEIGHRVNVSRSLFPEYPGQIQLETLSIAPRIFRIRNLISDEECKLLIELNKNNMTRSAVGKVDNYDQTESPKTNRRTSTNNFDYTSNASLAVMSRIFSLLHIVGREAIEDGLQVVRYGQNEAYDVHTDFFPVGFSSELGHNFDPGSGGANRYATVFAFLNDDFQGGQTVFPHVPKPEKDAPRTCAPLERGSDSNWTDRMTQGMCNQSLAVTPVQGDAVLFYSMKNNGRLDPLTEHGGCPVSNGTKYGANLWVWNRGKFGSQTAYEATFANQLSVPVQLFFFSTQYDPPLMPMGNISAHGSAAFRASKGDVFVAHSGTEWVGKFVVQEHHHRHQAFRISGSSQTELLNSFEYHIGFGAGLHFAHDHALQDGSPGELQPEKPITPEQTTPSEGSTTPEEKPL